MHFLAAVSESGGWGSIALFITMSAIDQADGSATARNAGLAGRVFTRAGGMASRYGLSAFGPFAMSAAHFVAGILLLRALKPEAFGAFSFALILVPLCLSAAGSLVNAAAAVAMRSDALGPAELSMYMKVSAILSLCAGLSVFALMMVSGMDAQVAGLLGFYALAMTLRWFARSYSYIRQRIFYVLSSDLAYAGLLVALLLGLSLTRELAPLDAAASLAIAASVAYAVFGFDFIKRHISALLHGSLRPYKTVWRDLTRWSLLGVISTEITANAHAYIVTLVAGAKAFALLAAGYLFMRPVALCLSALPDLERPAMARGINAGDNRAAWRQVGEFRLASVFVWCVTVALTGATLLWFPHLFLKHAYNRDEVFVVAVLWAAIMMVRLVRTPESVLLQAAREFRALSGASLWSSGFSVVLTLVLLLLFGPIASLLGILVGDLIMTGITLSLARRWRLANV